MATDRNIEFKARVSRIEEIRDRLKERKVECIGTDYQVDTYFRVPRGRLKIREGAIENCLVSYERENTAGPKPCRYRILRFQKNDPRVAELKLLLEESLGIMVRVEKTREIFMDGNVKIHLDKVPDLGMFVEIEAMETENRGEHDLREQCSWYLKQFGIGQSQLVAESYADLMLGICRQSGLDR